MNWRSIILNPCMCVADDERKKKRNAEPMKGKIDMKNEIYGQRISLADDLFFIKSESLCKSKMTIKSDV